MFDPLIVPVLIAFDSASTAGFQDPSKYEAELVSELSNIHTLFGDHRLKEIEIRSFYLPMNNKGLLQHAFNKRLKAYR